MTLTDEDLQRGWYPCPRCHAEVMVWPMAGDTGDLAEGLEPQTHRDLCADCEPI